MARDPLSRQIIVCGRIADGLTGARPRAMPTLLAEGPRGLLLRVGEDGLYSVSALPEIAMPLPGDIIVLRATADGYQDATAQVVLSGADLARLDRLVMIGGVAALLPGFPALPLSRDIGLLPRAVALKGRVSKAEDPALPLPGARVGITAPIVAAPVQADAAGFFTLSALPVSLEITLRITADDHDDADIIVRPDFSQAISRAAFTLVTS